MTRSILAIVTAYLDARANGCSGCATASVLRSCELGAECYGGYDKGGAQALRTLTVASVGKALLTLNQRDRDGYFGYCRSKGNILAIQQWFNCSQRTAYRKRDKIQDQIMFRFDILGIRRMTAEEKSDYLKNNH